MNFRKLAKKAHGGDKEALSVLVIEAPAGMMGNMSPESFAEMLNGNEEMLDQMSSKDHFSKDSYDPYETEDEEGPSEDKYPDEHHAAMKQMAAELYKASKLHAGQADKLIEICKEMYGESKDDSSEGDSY